MRKLILLLCLMLTAIGTQAQEYKYIQRGEAAKKAGGEQLADFKKYVERLAKYNNEDSILNAVMCYYGLGDDNAAKSLVETAKKKFPRGIAMRSADFNKWQDIKDAATKEKAYKELLKKYPEKNFKSREIYGSGIVSMATAYAAEGNTAKALEYARKVADPIWKSSTYNSVAAALGKAGKKEDAGKVLKEACDALEKESDDIRKGAESSTGIYGAYAEWLAENSNEEEAWKLYNTRVKESNRGESYWKLALQHGRTMQTWTSLDDLLRKGDLNKAGIELMREAWTKANGSADGFDDYVEHANQKRVEEMLAKVSDKMVKKPAPDFTLKDIDGNEVQLSKLRGKVVVLDFWATWCNPCKRSLPAMKKTLERYKDDPDVVFLFIHTWERGTAEEACKDAKAYLHDHGFDEFHLVMDTRGPEEKTNKAVSAFGVRGIPAKFVIDKQGYIRFEITGFGGSDDDAVAELTRMIELTRNAN